MNPFAHSSGQGASPEILLVISSLDVGGTEKHVVDMATALRQRGLDVAVYGFADGPRANDLRRAGVPLTLAPMNAGRNAGTLRKTAGLVACGGHLLWTLAVQRPRVVHFFLPEAYLIGGCLAALARTPVRVMSRRSLNDYQRGYPPFVRRIEHALHGTMTAILGNSRSVVRQLRDSEGVAADRIGLIYNGIDPATFATDDAREKVRHSVRGRLGLPDSALVMAMIANLIPYKGHSDLLVALAGIAPQLPDGWRVLLAGRDDGAGAELREQARRLSIADHVMFMNPRTDVADILAASDIGILCSHQEGFSNAVLEGMAAGLPMVVTAVGGNPEAVIDGENGFVVPPRAPAQLGEAILRLAQDASLRGRLGAAARARVVDQFSLTRSAERYEQFYRSLLAGRVLQDAPQIRAVS